MLDQKFMRGAIGIGEGRGVALQGDRGASPVIAHGAGACFFSQTAKFLEDCFRLIDRACHLSALSIYPGRTEKLCSTFPSRLIKVTVAFSGVTSKVAWPE